VTKEKAQIALALGGVFFVLLACKHTYTPPGTATDAASAIDVVIERDTTATGACDPTGKKYKCLANDKAAWCKTHWESTGRRSGKEVGEWQTMSCSDCDDATGYLRCSSYAPGEECNSFITRDRCSKDGSAQFICDHFTNQWKIESCPNCNDTGAYVQCFK
jgi:hypothetical protein